MNTPDEWKSQNADEIYAAQRMAAIGSAAAAVKDWRLAAKMFDEVSKLVPSAQVFSNAGEAYGYMGKVEKSAQFFEQSVRMDPNYFDALFNMGVMYELANLPEKAIEAYERGLKLREHPSARNNLANCQRALLRLEDSEKNYRKAMEVGYPGAQMNLSLLLMLKGDYIEGIKMFEKREEYGSDAAYGPARAMLAMLRDERA